MPGAARTEAVVLEFPANVARLQLARVVTASVGSSLELDYETIEDLRLGVDELCAALLDGIEAVGPLRLELRADGPTLRVTGTVATSGTAPAVELDEIARHIVETVTDSFELTPDGDQRRFLFEKTLRPA